MRVGVIGLGAIGKAIVPNLLKAGFETTVWNRTPQAANDLLELGAVRAERVGDLFRNDVVLSLLFDDDAVRSVFLQSDTLASTQAQTIHVCMSTISTGLVGEMMQAHAAQNVGYVAGPFMGRPEAAAAAGLHFMTAGDAAHLARVEPVLAALGKTWRMGADPRLGHIAKIAANFMLGSAVEAMHESAGLISSLRGDPAPFLSMMTETFFAAPAYRQMAPVIAAGNFRRPPEATRIAVKDMGLAVAEGAAGATPVPFAEVMLDRLRKGQL